MNRLNPMDILQNETIVIINNDRKGKVIGYEILDARPSGKIVVHEFLITHKIKILPANKRKWIEIEKPYKYKCNYSFVTY